MRFIHTVAMFIAVGCSSLPETPAKKPAVNSGIEGTTSSLVIGGVAGSKPTGEPASIEFAIAPLEGDKPAFDRAIFVKSERDGKYRVALPPGKYWIGPKAQAQGATNFPPLDVEFRAKTAVVTEGALTHVDLSEIHLAP